MRPSLRPVLVWSLLSFGCPEARSGWGLDPEATRDGGSQHDSDGGATVPDAGQNGDGGTDAGTLPVEGLELMSRLIGLWVGPVTHTPLGDFPTMNMDLRPVGGHYLFGRVDLDAKNSLRFAFSVETLGGQDVLVFRNGGYFQGILRDTRTELIERNEAQERYRFCHPARGCEYVDATFDFDGPAKLLLDVKVRGHQHVWWVATRRETRATPTPFPRDAHPQGDGMGPFPSLPTVTVKVRWSRPLTTPADVWLLLSANPCLSAGASCAPSRFIRAEVAAAQTEATLAVQQLHPGAYHATAVLDLNRNLGRVLFPDRGDEISAPDALLEVESADSSATLPIVLSVP